jgi:hypothetical protein
MQNHPKHDEDFYGWAINTAALLKQKKYHEVDMNSIIEELEEMSRSEKRELINRLAQLIFHLLKWQFQPDFRGRSWRASIKEQRQQVEIILEQNHGLKSKLKDCIITAYKLSIPMIEKETPIDMKDFPTECPYTFDQLVNEEFFPE